MQLGIVGYVEDVDTDSKTGRRGPAERPLPSAILDAAFYRGFTPPKPAPPPVPGSATA